MRVFCVLVPGAAARPLAVRAASFARRVVSKPVPRAARLPSAALRAARSVCRSLSEGLVFSCLSACWCPGGGGPPARRPCRELRSARRLEARAASCPLAVRRAASCPFGVRAVSCPLAVRGACVLLLVCVLAPGGGGPPARRPRRELRSARRLEARPGPAAAPRHQSQHRCPASRLVPAWGGSCVGENPQLSRTHRPATAS